MARQQFEQGQTVYVARWNRTNWHKAIVANPDIVQMSSGWSSTRRPIHYVGVDYVVEAGRDAGKVDTERTWNILNNRQQIIDEERYAEIARGQNIGELRQTIDTYRAVETDFARYVEQARIILEAQVTRAGLGDIDELANYLRGTFSFQSQYSRRSRADVRKARADKRKAAQAAHLTLQGMGETPPELP